MSRKSQRKSQRKREKRGGAGAADHAIAVYGDAGQQTAMGGIDGNKIAVNTMAGGNCQSIKPLVGGNLLTDIAVPAVLLYANTAIKPSKKLISRSKFNSKSRRRNAKSVRLTRKSRR